MNAHAMFEMYVLQSILPISEKVQGNEKQPNKASSYWDSNLPFRVLVGE